MAQSSEISFTGRVAAITGAPSLLGRAYAEYLAENGADLVLHAEDARAAATLARDISAIGRRAVAVGGAVSLVATADDLVSTAIGTYGRLDILVNTGGGFLDGSLSDLEDEQVRSVIDQQVLGAIWLTRAALPVMEAAGFGRIVNTTSSDGVFGQPGSSVHSAVTGAVIGFTRSIALDLRGSNVKVNAVSPIVDPVAQPSVDRATTPGDYFSPQMVVPTVAYLCHESCELNGQLLSVGGGRVARIFSGTSVGYFDPEAEPLTISRNLHRIVATDKPFFLTTAHDERLLTDV